MGIGVAKKYKYVLGRRIEIEMCKAVFLTLGVKTAQKKRKRSRKKSSQGVRPALRKGT